MPTLNPTYFICRQPYFPLITTELHVQREHVLAKARRSFSSSGRMVRGFSVSPHIKLCLSPVGVGLAAG